MIGDQRQAHRRSETYDGRETESVLALPPFLLAEKMVCIKISILQGSVTGTGVFSETHRIQTNVNGLVSLMIGGGTNAIGKIADINWGA